MSRIISVLSGEGEASHSPAGSRWGCIGVRYLHYPCAPSCRLVPHRDMPAPPPPTTSPAGPAPQTNSAILVLASAPPPHLQVLHRYSLRDVEPQAEPVDAKAVTRHDPVHRLDPELGHDLVEPALPADLRGGGRGGRGEDGGKGSGDGRQETGNGGLTRSGERRGSGE